MRSWSFALLFLLLVLPIACKKEEPASEAPAPAQQAEQASAEKELDSSVGYIASSGNARAASPAPPATAPGAPVAASQASAVARKLIRTVNLRLEVSNPETTSAEVQELVKRLGGYVGSLNGERRGELMYITLTVRVPVERLDEALQAIRSFAVRVDQEHQQVDDVTDQYVDLDARMRTLEATEQELRALLAESRQRARKVGEIMEVYQQLIEVRSQIEQIRAQLVSFDKLAALSTLNLELVPTESAKPVVNEDEWRPGDTLRGSARTLMGFLRWLLDAVIYFVIVLLPIGLVIGVAFLALRWVWKRRKKAEPEG